MAAGRWVDLHLHSTASDGAHSPRTLVTASRQRGLAAVAITDHDTVSGLAEGAVAAKEAGVQFVPGIELGATHGRGTLHILGYFVSSGSAALKSALAQIIQWRHERNVGIVERLAGLGVALDYGQVQRASPGAVIGRVHIGRALVGLKVVVSVEQAFSRYLAKDAAAWVPRRKLSAEECIDVIRSAGGVASLAHPVHLGCESELELRTLLRGLRDAHLEAIEVYHPHHTDRQTRLYVELAAGFKLLLTGGSDLHHGGVSGGSTGVGFARVRVPHLVLDALRARAGQ